MKRLTPAERDALARQWRYLCLSLAKKRAYTTGLDIDELIGAAHVAFVRALNGFDPTKGWQFSTYAGTAIRHALTQYVTAQRRECRTPPGTVISTATTREDDWSDMLPGKESDPLARLEMEEERGILAGQLARLPPREAAVVRWRLKGETFREIAGRLGVCRARVRELYLTAVERMRGKVAVC